MFNRVQVICCEINSLLFISTRVFQEILGFLDKMDLKDQR